MERRTPEHKKTRREKRREARKKQAKWACECRYCRNYHPEANNPPYGVCHNEFPKLTDHLLPDDGCTVGFVRKPIEEL